MSQYVQVSEVVEVAAGAGVRVSDEGPWLSWAELHPVAVELDAMSPGPTLASRLAELVPADLDDAALVEAVAGFERIASWAAAGQGRMISELNRRRLATSRDFVAEEVAVRLCVTGGVAEGKVALALELDRLPMVADALAAGDLDVRRATVLAEETAHLPEHVAQDVATLVLPAAVQCTAPQLRNKLRRLECLRDPDGAQVRHRRAVDQRRVELIPTGDAMAWLSAYLPAPDAVAVHTALTALAQHTDDGTGGLSCAQGPHDTTPLDTRTLDQRRADVLVDLATRWLDAGVHPDGTPLPTTQGRRPHLMLTATAETILGLADTPGVLDGYGVIPAGLARQIAARATWEPLLVSAATGEPLARSTCSYTPTQALRDAVIQRDRTCTFPGCRRPAIRCDLDHIDPYDPTRPGDHQTCLANLHALCRHHHRAKTHTRWNVTRTPDGTTTWQAPTGHTYQRLPDHPPPHEPGPAEPEPDPWGTPWDDAWTHDGADPARDGADRAQDSAHDSADDDQPIPF